MLRRVATMVEIASSREILAGAGEKKKTHDKPLSRL